MAEEAILSRIKKLLALAESPNEHEAAAAAAKAQELLTQHNLALVDLEDVDPARREKVEQSDWADVVYPSNKVAGWREDLFIAVTQTTYCKGWFHNKTKRDAAGQREYKYDALGRFRQKYEHEAIVIGRPSDVEVAKYLYTYLTRTLYRLSDEYAWTHGNRKVRGNINHLRAGFLKGAIAILTMRLYTEWKRAQETEQVYGLVVVRGKELTAWMAAKDIVLVNAGASGRRGADPLAHAAGAAAGRSMALNRGIGTGQGPKALG